MVYSAYACETVTGKNLGPLDVTVSAWARELNGTDTATVNLYPGALTLASRDLYRLYTTGKKMSLVIEWSNPGDPIGTPVFAGPIQNRVWDGKSLAINAVDVKVGVFSKRKALNWIAPYALQTLAYSNMSLGSIAAALGQLGTSGSKPGAALPIIWPASVPDSDPTHVRNYFGFNLNDMASIWSLLTGVINGPDIDFLPQWSDANRTSIQYLFRVGTSSSPNIGAAQPVAFDAAQPGSSVKELTSTEDWSQLVTSQWAKGSGQDVDTVMSFTQSSGLVNAGYPLLEGETDYTSVGNQAELDAHTQGDLSLHQAPTVQWGFTVDGTLPPVLGSYQLGDPANVRVANHFWIPDSPPAGYPMRIVGMSGDTSTSIKLKVQ